MFFSVRLYWILLVIETVLAAPIARVGSQLVRSNRVRCNSSVFADSARKSTYSAFHSSPFRFSYHHIRNWKRLSIALLVCMDIARVHVPVSTPGHGNVQCTWYLHSPVMFHLKKDRSSRLSTAGVRGLGCGRRKLCDFFQSLRFFLLCKIGCAAWAAPLVWWLCELWKSTNVILEVLLSKHAEYGYKMRFLLKPAGFIPKKNWTGSGTYINVCRQFDNRLNPTGTKTNF